MVDRFGNVALDVDHDDIGGHAASRSAAPVEIEVGRRALPAPRYAQTFADVRPGELLVYEDAYRTLARGDQPRRRRGDARRCAPDAEVAAAAAMIGAPRVHHRLTDSTNERARELAAPGAPHGTLVTADEQTAGRGRQGRTWTRAAAARRC